MNLAENSFNLLFPEKQHNYEFSVKYSAKFKPYNANVRLYKNILTLSLSKKWRTVDRDIQIGLIQSLLIKILKIKKHTEYIELYNTFMKKLSSFAPKTKSDPLLDESFNRVNDKYFFGLIDKPNLIWGNHSFSKLGSYEYGSDTITISRIFEDNKALLDYIMYHEMLHKKHKFYTKNGRSYHHTAIFKKKEKEFKDSKEMEKEISKLISVNYVKHKMKTFKYRLLSPFRR